MGCALGPHLRQPGPLQLVYKTVRYTLHERLISYYQHLLNQFLHIDLFEITSFKTNSGTNFSRIQSYIFLTLKDKHFHPYRFTTKYQNSLQKKCGFQCFSGKNHNSSNVYFLIRFLTRSKSHFQLFEAMCVYGN